MQPRYLPAAFAALALALTSVAALAGGPAPAAPPAPAPPAPAKPPPGKAAEPAPAGAGIVFEKTTFAEALAKAKAATRPLFVDFFSEG